MAPDPADKPPVPDFVLYPVHPDLLAWAKQTFDEREFMDGVREIEETGGRTLESFIAEVEAAARGS